MKLNKTNHVYTHEGGRASKASPEEQLRRSVMACMLWEDTFYEDGVSIAERIEKEVEQVDPTTAAFIARDARREMHIRHAPLLIARIMARLPRHKCDVAWLLNDIIQRPDELTEFLAVYNKDKRQTLSAQVKKGLARAIKKFDEYQLAKYNRKATYRLSHILKLCHPRPNTTDQERLWARLLADELKTPDTWEVALSSGADKKTTWERLLKEERLGGMALLRNLRNMVEVGVDQNIIKESINNMNTSRILPFRFIAAARYAPRFEPEIENALLRSLQGTEKLKGKTILLVDVSGSMNTTLSHKSEMTRIDAACGLGVGARELCEDVQVYTFSEFLALVPPRRGFALRDAINNSQRHGGTWLKNALKELMEQEHDAERIIIITDEQSHDGICGTLYNKQYILNVASYTNSVGYSDWVHINGWSDAILKYITTYESTSFRPWYS